MFEWLKERERRADACGCVGTVGLPPAVNSAGLPPGVNSAGVEPKRSALKVFRRVTFCASRAGLALGVSVRATAVNVPKLAIGTPGVNVPKLAIGTPGALPLSVAAVSLSLHRLVVVAEAATAALAPACAWFPDLEVDPSFIGLVHVSRCSGGAQRHMHWQPAHMHWHAHHVPRDAQHDPKHASIDCTVSTHRRRTPPQASRTALQSHAWSTYRVAAGLEHGCPINSKSSYMHGPTVPQSEWMKMRPHRHAR